MARSAITARFDSHAVASAAAERLKRLGVSRDDYRLQGSAARADADCWVVARVDDAYCSMAVDALHSGGAIKVEVAHLRPGNSDWLSHHDNAVTSTGVPPGQGDSEAGNPD